MKTTEERLTAIEKHLGISKEQPIDKFAELKEAHKNGAVIQYKSELDPFEWCDTYDPNWNSNYEYRVKPQNGWSNNVDSKTWTISFDNPIQSIHDDFKNLIEKYPQYNITITVEGKV